MDLYDSQTGAHVGKALGIEDCVAILSEPRMALEFAVSAAVGAQNRLLANEPSRVVLLQDQANLWLAIHARLREQELQDQFDADSGRLGDKDAFSKGMAAGLAAAASRERFRAHQSHVDSELGRARDSRKPANSDKDYPFGEPRPGDLRGLPGHMQEMGTDGQGHNVADPSVKPFRDTSSGSEERPVS